MFRNNFKSRKLAGTLFHIAATTVPITPTANGNLSLSKLRCFTWLMIHFWKHFYTSNVILPERLRDTCHYHNFAQLLGQKYLYIVLRVRVDITLLTLPFSRPPLVITSERT